MPGTAIQYVADLSAVLHGSMKPREIRWELQYSHGLQLQIEYWREKGRYCVKA